MILLLRKPHTFSEENVRLAAERAWGLSFLGGDALGATGFLFRSVGRGEV